MNISKKKYKALILDVDGTLIAKHNSMPSPKVTAAIQKASKKIPIGLATSRPIKWTKRFFENLPFYAPSILHSGGKIVDSHSQETLWEQPLVYEDMLNTAELLQRYKLKFLVNDNGEDLPYRQGMKIQKPLHMWVQQVTKPKAKKLMQKFSHMKTIIAHCSPSAEYPEKTDIVITHVSATKQHGLLEVARILNITPEEIIGVEDSMNDYPLLMACGLKIAMGNAHKELKAIADYIAPSVTNDGVADVIEKFVL